MQANLMKQNISTNKKHFYSCVAQVVYLNINLPSSSLILHGSLVSQIERGTHAAINARQARAIMI